MNLREQTRDHLKDLSPSIKLSFGANNPTVQSALYFFYHIPKCGGMDFYACLRGALISNNKLKQTPAFTGRSDTWEDIQNQKPSISEIDPENLASTMGIFASHGGDTFFRELFHDTVYNAAKKISFIREPYSRAISDYTYSNMRKSEPVSEDGFKAFIEQTSQQNRMSKCLLGEHFDHDMLIEFVSSFDVFLTLDKQDDVVETLLTDHGLPNVFRDPINRTMTKFRLDGAVENNELKSYFYELNASDVSIHNVAKENSQSYQSSTDDGVNVHSVVMSPSQSEDSFAAKNFLLPTGDIVKAKARVPTSESINAFLRHFGIQAPDQVRQTG